jgi:Protein of unknown function (DUF3500)
MKTIYLRPIITLLCMIFSWQNLKAQDSKITFMLKITELENPETVSVIGPVQPWVNFNSAQKTEMKIDENGYYVAVVGIPDPLLDRKLKYIFRNKNKTDIRREIIIKENSHIIQTDLWGYLDGFGKKIKPFQQMPAMQTETPEEAAVLAKPYFGITYDGNKETDLFPIQKTGQTTLPTKKAVEAFLSSLSADQKAKCTFPVNSDEWRKWHNIEFYKRTGIGLEELNPAQKELAFNILEASLSPKGLKKSKDVMSMEAYLAYITPSNKLLGGEKYWFTFMGSPSATDPWGFQFDGHHLIINYFIMGDQVVMTPTFMGSEPNIIAEGPNKGLRTYEAEERKGLAFFKSLNAKQKDKATVWHNLDQDFNRTEGFRDNETLAKQGISAKELTLKQKEILLDLVKEYVGNMKEGHAKVKMAEVRKYLNETNFSWVQTDGVDDLFYYRIHSPVILIEFDHQIPVSVWDRNKPRPGPVKYHIHTVVRTPNGNDYGKDLLRQHLLNEH